MSINLEVNDHVGFYHGTSKVSGMTESASSSLQRIDFAPSHSAHMPMDLCLNEIPGNVLKSTCHAKLQCIFALSIDVIPTNSMDDSQKHNSQERKMLVLFLFFAKGGVVFIKKERGGERRK